ncbi:hypothetical protein D3875_14705 [Deinococcus cavernae]|uniref:Uncharacterized protein n=2 Tax=Deinococcus cavernae TaxID=2320857 RepID=A0A418V911_9DEIO|nr:hypothetical protein D3875_14705 [Deinococcus cavernae]
MPVWQPPHMDFGTFMREVDSLALAQAQQTLPVGSTVMVQTDPARRGFKGRTGIHWTSASDRRVTASKPLSLLVMLFLLGFGVFMLLSSGAMLWASTSGALSR